jgi:hypothetical protein
MSEYACEAPAMSRPTHTGRPASPREAAVCPLTFGHSLGLPRVSGGEGSRTLGLCRAKAALYH